MLASVLHARRLLGVRVDRIGVAATTGRSASAAHLVGDDLPGWHATERDGAGRWTTGDAVLPLVPTTEPLFLDIEVLSAGPYPDPHAA